MKNRFIYVELNILKKALALKCYDRICKKIKKVHPNDKNVDFLKEYRFYVQNNQIKPANISRKVLTPYWDVIGNMIETKILIKILKQ